MEPLEFCRWLRGALEYKRNYAPLTLEEQMIEDHLNLVFNKVTPDRSRDTSPKPPAEEQETPETSTQPTGAKKPSKKSPTSEGCEKESSTEDAGGKTGGVDWAKILEDAKKLKLGPVPYDPNPGP